MKIKDLLKKLEGEDPETILVMSSDGEGNNYSPLAGADKGEYLAYNTWSGYSVCEDMREEMEADEDPDLEKVQKAIFLYPVN